MNKVFLLILITAILTSCQSAKDALTLKKRPSGDEFLIEKKNPLVMPPDYGKLPTPENQKMDQIIEEDNDIENILSKNKKDIKGSSTIESNSEPTSLEKSILEKIK